MSRKKSVLMLPCYRMSRNVAITVFKSDRRHDEEEARTLKRLTEGPTSNSGKSHVVQLLDQFISVGPNGRHLCLVIEVLGPMIEPDELSPEAAWEIARQLAETTAYFHGLGVARGGMFCVA